MGIFENVIVFLFVVNNVQGFTASTTNKPSLANSWKLYDTGTLRENGWIFPEDDGDSNEAINMDTFVKKVTSVDEITEEEKSLEEDEDAYENLTEQELLDLEMMQKAIQMAQSSGGEKGSHSPYPKPIVGAVIATEEGKILGLGRSNYEKDAIQAVIAEAGIDATPLSEWCVTWPRNSELREGLKKSTLYITLEPSAERQGTSLPPLTQLIQQSGIPRVVIGCPDPVPELASKGAATLHHAGLSVVMGTLQKDCTSLIKEYSTLTNTKLQKMARNHFNKEGRPLGFMHCSVVDSDDIACFSRNGNAFGKNFGGKELSFRDLGSYKLAPPPESIWAKDTKSRDDTFTEVDDFFTDLEEEQYQENLDTNPMMPWYAQVDAVVATFPREGNGPADDNSISGRLYGLKWLATSGVQLPANVERILVMDATDLHDLPLSNDDPNLPKGVDVETFWKANGRKQTRVLLRHGDNAEAIAAANAAAQAAAAAAQAAQRAKVAIESGKAEEAAESALECQQAALQATAALQKEIQLSQKLKSKLTNMGVKVEVIKGREPIDVMKHLGTRNGYKSVVWRAGCWGQRGVDAIIAGAFQWVSAHVAVDAAGGKFWQLMLAERAIQAACGPESRVKILAEQEDISLEYCDESDDEDCVLSVNGTPIRHVRLDCRVVVMHPSRSTEYILTKTTPMKKRVSEKAPWFL